ncbi:MAG TPA: helix-turn-helix transcriptional regulator [Candidatus Enterenecus merdae]|nr:helix-turn-helix transcriptional regulator [Candidatus Enterenecus merdae]
MDGNKTGQFIVQRLRELGLTQKELAEKLNASDRAVSKWERGDRQGGEERACARR